MDPKDSQQEDEQIAGLVQSGKSEFFGILINRYQDKITRYARKFLSDADQTKDIVQEVFIKAYVNIQSFDTKRKFSPWLYRIAHNEFVNTLRKNQNRFLPIFNLDTFFPHYASKDIGISEQLERKEMKELVEVCVNKLEVKYKEPIILYYIEELSYKEIADVMAIPVSTVGIRIKRAKDMMQEIFKQEGFQYGK